MSGTPITDLMSHLLSLGHSGQQVSEIIRLAEIAFRQSVDNVDVKREAERIRKASYRSRMSLKKTGHATLLPLPLEKIPSLVKQENKREVDVSTRVPGTTKNNRGSRISPDWSPSTAERYFAKQEGFSDYEIDREVGNFRDYWVACAGAKGIKLDWPSTWRRWIRNGAERAGKVRQPDPGQPVAGQFYAASGSDQLMAWDYHRLTMTGKASPRDKKGGWYFETEWPPGHGCLPLEQPNGATK